MIVRILLLYWHPDLFFGDLVDCTALGCELSCCAGASLVDTAANSTAWPVDKFMPRERRPETDCRHSERFEAVVNV